MESNVTLHGKPVVALNLTRLANRCLTSKATASRWLTSGELKPAQNGASGEVQYFYVADIEKLRAGNLDQIRIKLAAGAGLTMDERASVATAGLQDFAEGLRQLQAMFARMLEVENQKKRAAAKAR